MKPTYQNQIEKTIQIVFSLFLIFCFSLANAQKLKGKLFIIGGGNRSDQLMQHVVDLAQFKKTDYVVVLPMSSEEPDSAYIYFKDQFQKLVPNKIVMLNFDKNTAQRLLTKSKTYFYKWR
jgi:cyanophycinase